MTARLPRSDARDNRGRILDAALMLCAAGSLEVPIREIARHAQVGPATVYRHFPTKQTLLSTVFVEQSRTWRAALDQGLADPYPWRGFQLAFSRLCELQARDMGFTTAFKSAFPHAVDFPRLRTASLMSAAALVNRVKDTGHLRTGVNLEDVLLMLTAGNGIGVRNHAAIRRYAELATTALHAE